MSDLINDAARERTSEPELPPWERGVLEKMAMELVTERRRARRWSIFFKLLTIAYVAGMTVYLLGLWTTSASEPAGTGLTHTAKVEIEGSLAAKGENDAQKVIKSLQKAFADPGTRGVVLFIDSPGGSPVQASLIYDEIKRLRAANPTIPMHAVVGEACASGGYYVAAAADRIFVNPSSLVGSIGVLMNGFGFVDAMHKLGVERRLITAGDDKGFGDPFSPLPADQRAHLETLLKDIHQQFIDAVRNGRGDRLKPDADVFSGLVWTGRRAIELGLADGLGTVDTVARDEIGAERVVDFTRQDSLVERFAKRIGASMGFAFGETLLGAGSSLELR